MKNKKVKLMIAGQCSDLMGLKFEWKKGKLYFYTNKTRLWPSRIVELKHFGGPYSLTGEQMRGIK